MSTEVAAPIASKTRSSAVPKAPRQRVDHRMIVRELEARLEEAEQTLGAIRRGEIDAVVIGDETTEHKVYTLENADRPYRMLIENIREGAVTLATDGTVLYCNSRMAEMLGTPQEQVVGHTLQPFLQRDDASGFQALLAAAQHRHARGEFTLRGVNGTAIPIYVSLSRLILDGGEHLLCGVVADLTQQKLHLRELSDVNARLMHESAQREVAEAALRQSQKMEAVGQLTGGLAHDFNNLLTSISGSLELMQARLAQGRTEDLPRYIGIATASADRAAALTHRLLAFSRRQVLDPKLIAANSLVVGMEDLLRRTVGPAITIKTMLPLAVGLILCDLNQMENALLNLAINARDAMPQGGLLVIETADTEMHATDAMRRDMPPGCYIALSVTDTGTGMTAEVAAHAFDPFFTTKPIGEGTGLGLSMIYGFVKQSRGQVRIHSVLGMGTTVCMYLPRHEGAAGAVVAPKGEQVAPRANEGETVLVVDDEPVLRMLMVEVLEELGYIALEAADARGGLRLIEAGVRVDLLVTDVGMPGGMNGRQFANAARVLRPDLGILFVTGFAPGGIVGDGGMQPGMEVLTKPFAMDTLASRIRTMITSRG